MNPIYMQELKTKGMKLLDTFQVVNFSNRNCLKTTAHFTLLSLKVAKVD